MTYYLAIDIGASSGRHLLGSVSNGKLQFEEIYRFENHLIEDSGHLCWDADRLFSEVLNGLKKCRELDKIPKTVAIDTWGVDYVLLDEEGNAMKPVFSYRDSRTKSVVDEVHSIISAETLYARTGIQFQSFNTLYQLYLDKLNGRLEKAHSFLMIPDYLSFRLTGKMNNEYTNSTTTNLISPKTKTWDSEILHRLGIKSSLFQTPSLPGTKVGKLKEEIIKETGINPTIVLCPSHDTASAVAACPLDDHSLFISSGTWSLVGMEIQEPIINEKARIANFTNEGGLEYRYRFLKNYTGMWILQNIRKDTNRKYSYDEMMNMAKGSRFRETININAADLMAPGNMTDTIREHLGLPDLPFEDVLSCVYRSLAESYRLACEQIEDLSGREIRTISIVGGGSKDSYLNQLSGEYTGKAILPGPTEATAAGNILSQIMYDRSLSLESMREMIKQSFDITEVQK